MNRPLLLAAVGLLPACSDMTLHPLPLDKWDGAELILSHTLYESGVSGVIASIYTPSTPRCRSLPVGAEATLNGVDVPTISRGGTIHSSYYLIPTKYCEAPLMQFVAGVDDGDIAFGEIFDFELSDNTATWALRHRTALSLAFARVNNDDVFPGERVPLTGPEGRYESFTLSCVSDVSQEQVSWTSGPGEGQASPSLIAPEAPPGDYTCYVSGTMALDIEDCVGFAACAHTATFTSEIHLDLMDVDEWGTEG